MKVDGEASFLLETVICGLFCNGPPPFPDLLASALSTTVATSYPGRVPSWGWLTERTAPIAFRR
jgi:hypothetical protein